MHQDAYTVRGSLPGPPCLPSEHIIGKMPGGREGSAGRSRKAAEQGVRTRKGLPAYKLCIDT